MIVDEFRLSSGQAKQYEQEGLNAQAAPVPFAGLGWAVETGMVRFRFAFTHHGHSLSHYGSLMFSFPRMLSSTRDVGQSMDRHIQTYIFFDFLQWGKNQLSSAHSGSNRALLGCHCGTACGFCSAHADADGYVNRDS